MTQHSFNNFFSVTLDIAHAKKWGKVCLANKYFKKNHIEVIIENDFKVYKQNKNIPVSWHES